MAEPDAWHPVGAGKSPWIASIGHSDHGTDAFFSLLHDADVRALVDVRHFPRSRVAHFNKESLAPECRSRGITYHHLPGLGGKRAVTYPEHMATEEWGRAYDSLREIAWSAIHGGGLAAFLCVERDPARCHRRFIAVRLERDGWRVRHLLPDAAQTRLF